MTGGPGVRIAYLTTAALAPVTLVLSRLAPTGALLPALLFWTAALQGLIALVAAADLTRARWIRPIRDVLLDLHPLLFAPAIGFLIFTREIRLYPWTEHPTGWLEPHFFILRNVVLLLLTGVLAAFYARSAHATRAAGRKTLAVVYLFAFVANQSLIAFDWVMSFEYPWTSTLFGGYFFVEALYAGIALTVLTAAWLVRRQRDTGGPSPVAAGALLDSTTLLFGFSLLWAGQFFAQFLVIWYGNLPAEVAFIARRWTAGPLGLLSRLVLWLLFLIPFVILLSRRAKTTPLFSSSMALIVLSGVLVERIVFLIPVTHLDPWVAGAAFLAYAVAFAIPYRVACGRLVSPPELPPASRPRVEPAVLLALALLTPAAIAARAQTGAEASAMVIPFDEVHWDLRSAWVGEHLGRESLAGTALLRDLEFGDGVIEVDVAVDGRRSYPGIFFRAASDSLPAAPGGSPGVPANCERLYLRPHRAGLYPDAIQYAPVVNGVTGWQLYSGEGCTAGIELPADQWIHLRLEVQDSQARLFMGAATAPALEIPVLGHGNRRGRL
ncbi:MAG: hypothetical protein V1774_02415, partial [Candidatus Eisenbacteria bacterium]